jgi:hypothetical protein
MDKYINKYIKYKNKYLELKNSLIGGAFDQDGEPLEIDDEIFDSDQDVVVQQANEFVLDSDDINEFHNYFNEAEQNEKNEQAT